MMTIALAFLAGIAVWSLLLWREKEGGRERTTPIRAHENGDIRYDRYEMSRHQQLTAMLTAMPALFAVGYLFYGNGMASACIALLAIFYPRLKAKRLQARRLAELSEQFKQMLYSLSSSLSAGKSTENALQDALYDMDKLVASGKPYMRSELAGILGRIRNGEPVEAAFRRFSERSGVEDIRHFAEVLAVCARSGGNLVEIVRRTAHVMTEKMDIEQDITVTIAQKRWEARMLGVMPFLLIAALKLGSPDYMEPLYQGPGRAVMTLALVMIAASAWWTDKMMDIKV